MESGKVDVTNMSLDDYIAMFDITKNEKYNANNFRQRNNDNTKFNRHRDSFDEDEEMENLNENVALNGKPNSLTNNAFMQQKCDNIWHGPDSSISYIACSNAKNDLRSKLLNNKCTPVTSVQDRLKVFNKGNSCLITVTNPNAGQTFRNERNNRWWPKKGRGHQNHNRFNTYPRNNNFNDNGNGYKNGLHGINNGRVYRKRVQTNFSGVASCITPIEKNDNQNYCNFILEEPRTSTSNVNHPNTAQLMAANEANSKLINNVSLKEMLGIDDKVDGDPLMVFAKHIIEMSKNATEALVHKPVYDMKTQKLIHDIQDKQLFYKTPGSTVVSFDGKGINCKITPQHSGLTLNCRFS